MKKILIIILLVVNIAAAIGLLLAYCAAYIDPQKIWFFAFFGLAYPIILIFNILFVILWLSLWRKYIFISFILLIAGWNHLQDIYPWKFGKTKIDEDVNLKVLTYNVHGFYGKESEKNQFETRQKMMEFISNVHADLILFQEFFLRGENLENVMKFHSNHLKMSHYFYTNYDGRPGKKRINAIAIFSKFPIINSGFLKLNRKNTHAIFADIIIQQDTIRVYNLHLASIRFGREDYSFYSHLTDPENEPENTPLKEGSKRMFSKLKKAFITRSAQVNELTMHMEQCRYPIILGGDFNDTPYSYTYHQITEHLRDAYKTAGSGFFESTYAGKLPAFRIDYITYSDFFSAIDYQKPSYTMSDHYPVIARLSIIAKKKRPWNSN